MFPFTSLQRCLSGAKALSDSSALFLFASSLPATIKRIADKLPEAQASTVRRRRRGLRLAQTINSLAVAQRQDKGDHKRNQQHRHFAKHAVDSPDRHATGHESCLPSADWLLSQSSYSRGLRPRQIIDELDFACFGPCSMVRLHSLNLGQHNDFSHAHSVCCCGVSGLANLTQECIQCSTKPSLQRIMHWRNQQQVWLLDLDCVACAHVYVGAGFTVTARNSSYCGPQGNWNACNLLGYFLP